MSSAPKVEPIYSEPGDARIENSDGTWKYKGPRPSMYDVEHKEMLAAIRAGKPINNGTYLSYSTLMAIMGREACYTGQTITSEAMLNSQFDMSPERYEWGDVTLPRVAMPGQTKLDRSA